MRVSDDEIINAILSTPTQKLAAEKLKITEQTLTKRLKNPRLKANINQYRKDCLKHTANRIIQQTDTALAKLFGLMNSENENIQLQAICKVLSYSAEFCKICDIQSRLDDLEEKFNNS